MKLSCTQENLNKGLSLAGKVVTPKVTLPILNNILLATNKGRLKISTTDLEIGINIWIGAKIEKQGKITVPARIISDFVSSCGDKKINLELEDQKLKLKTDNYKATIQGTVADEFPLIPEIKEKPTCSISGKILEEAIPQVTIATAIDETRPVLSGVCFKFFKDKLKLVATDSYRLAEKTIPLEKKVKSEQSVIIPLKTVQEMGRILSGVSTENVKVSVTENQVRFAINENIEIISRLIEGNFPNYEQIIPDSYSTKVKINFEDFKSALKVASLFAKESANNIKIKLSSGKDIEILAQAEQVGTSNAKAEAQISGEELEASFNSKFVLDGLTALKRGKINFELSGKLNPAKLSISDSKDYFYIIMPLRTEE